MKSINLRDYTTVTLESDQELGVFAEADYNLYKNETNLNDFHLIKLALCACGFDYFLHDVGGNAISDHEHTCRYRQDDDMED